mmetsp:Transcript_20256/g.40187  ORF Transcript_20256/g.40187 Transcript_20256/m.40187 type:complete len:143 (+) Transcript_20256:164-592(+)
MIKEVAPTKDAEDDEILGVNEFAATYFKGRPVFLDEKREFYAFLGNRGVTKAGLFSLGTVLRPWKLYGSLKEIGKRLAAKGGIEGNFKGDAMKLGGVLILSPGGADSDGELLFQYQEIMGGEVPVDDLEEGMLKLKAGNFAC